MNQGSRIDEQATRRRINKQIKATPNKKSKVQNLATLLQPTLQGYETAGPGPEDQGREPDMIRVGVYTHLHIYIYIYVYIYIHVYVCMYMYAHIYIYVRIHIIIAIIITYNIDVHTYM